MATEPGPQTVMLSNRFVNIGFYSQNMALFSDLSEIERIFKLKLLKLLDFEISPVCLKVHEINKTRTC